MSRHDMNQLQSLIRLRQMQRDQAAKRRSESYSDVQAIENRIDALQRSINAFRLSSDTAFNSSESSQARILQEREHYRSNLEAMIEECHRALDQAIREDRIRLQLLTAAQQHLDVITNLAARRQDEMIAAEMRRERIELEDLSHRRRAS